MNTFRRRLSFPTLCLATLTLAAGVAIALGPLNPPAGAISSSNRTLQEIYDKIPAADGRTLIPGGTTAVFINQPGSYVLTGNLNVTGTAINIAGAQGPVTLDLNGFRVSSSSLTAPVIRVFGCPQSLIRNGSVAGGDRGLDLALCNGMVIEDLRVSGSKTYGISVGGPTPPNATIRRCTVVDVGLTNTNGDTAQLSGIYVNNYPNATNTRIEDCTVALAVSGGETNQYIYGIYFTGSGGRITRCFVAGSPTYGSAVGIYADPGIVFSNNNVVDFPSATKYLGGTDGGGNF